MGVDLELEPADAGTHIDDVEQLASLMDEGGEGLLHADGRATTTDVTRERQQFLHRDEVAALVARDFGGLFQIDFLVAWDDTDEMSRFVPFQHQRLEHLVDVLAQLVGDMLCPEVVFIDFVGSSRNDRFRKMVSLQDNQETCMKSYMYLIQLLLPRLYY